eukprot:10117773-Heterocapsa_arctica.AAC.1
MFVASPMVITRALTEHQTKTTISIEKKLSIISYSRSIIMSRSTARQGTRAGYATAPPAPALYRIV